MSADARAVTGWTLDDAATGVYRAHVGTGFDTRQLYVDGVPAQRARISWRPRDITLNPDRVHHRQPGPRLPGHPARPEAHRAPGDAVVHQPVRAGARASPARPSTMQQPAWDNNTYGYDTIQARSARRRSSCSTPRRFLDEAGEWYLDTTAGTALLQAALGAGHARTRRWSCRAWNRSSRSAAPTTQPARDLAFRGLTFTGTTWLRPGLGQRVRQPADRRVHHRRPVPPARPTRSPRAPRAARDSRGPATTGRRRPRRCRCRRPTASTSSDNTFVNLGSVALGIGNDANAHATGVGLGAKNISVTGNTFTAKRRRRHRGRRRPTRRAPPVRPPDGQQRHRDQRQPRPRDGAWSTSTRPRSWPPTSPG